MAEAAPPGLAHVPVSRIVIGERRTRSLAGLDELKASIAADGLIHPLVLSPDRHLILGARRLEACRQLGWAEVPAVTATWIWQALDCLEAEQDDPRGARPFAVQEIMGADFALRELAWWRKAQPRRGSPGKGLNVGRQRRERLSRALGLNTHQYNALRELAHAARGYREAFGTRTPVTHAEQTCAARLLAAITGRSTIVAAHTRYCRTEYPASPLPLPRKPSPSPARSTRSDGRRSPQRAQAAQIEHGLAAAAGTLRALMSIRDIDPSIPAAQRSEWANGITDLIRDYSTFRRRLTKGLQ